VFASTQQKQTQKDTNVISKPLTPEQRLELIHRPFTINIFKPIKSWCGNSTPKTTRIDDSSWIS